MLRSVADQGDAEANYYLGVCNEKGIGKEASLEQAVLHFQAAANRGYMRAAAALLRLSHLPRPAVAHSLPRSSTRSPTPTPAPTPTPTPLPSAFGSQDPVAARPRRTSLARSHRGARTPIPAGSSPRHREARIVLARALFDNDPTSLSPIPAREPLPSASVSNSSVRRALPLSTFHHARYR